MPVEEVRIVQGRHAEVIEWYDPAQGKFAPVAELADDAKVVILAIEEGNRVLVSKDVKAGGVYDHCGYMVAQEWCSFEELEAFRDRIGGLGNFDRRVYVYSGGDRIMPTLMTIAGQHSQIRYTHGAENLAEHIADMDGFGAEVLGLHALSVWLT